MFSQNHDQVGNRAFGDRLSTQVPFEALKVTAASLLLSPNIPLLFMGEEFGETAPFLYFIDHGDQDLVEAVRRGRQAEFASFAWEGEIPDPQDPLTRERSCIHITGPLDPRQAAQLRWTKQLIELRTTVPSLGTGSSLSKHHVWSYEQDNVLVIHRRGDRGPDALLILSFNSARASVHLREPVGHWRLRLDSMGEEVEREDRERPPQEVIIVSEGVMLSIKAYTAAVYIRVA